MLAALDAKRGEVYALAQDLSSGAVTFEATSVPIGDLAARFKPLARPLFLVGAGAPIVAERASAQDERQHFRRDRRRPTSPMSPLSAFVPTRASLPAPLYARGADAKPQADKALARR